MSDGIDAEGVKLGDLFCNLHPEYRICQQDGRLTCSFSAHMLDRQALEASNPRAFGKPGRRQKVKV